MPTIQEYAEEIHQNARNKGFYDQIEELVAHPNLTLKQKGFIEYLWRASRLMLVVSELSEGLEGLRKGNMSGEPGSGGYAEEITDAGIRLLDSFKFDGLNAEALMRSKMDFNAKRAHMHGNKVA